MKVRLFVLVFLFVMFWGAWQVGAGVATDYIYWWPKELDSIFGLPQTWRGVLGADGMGQSVVSTLWSWPMMFVYSLFSRVGLGFGVISRLAGFLPVILMGVYSVDKLLASYKLNKWARAAGSLVYLANTYIVLLVDGGQLFIALAYAIVPLAFYFYKSVKTFLFILTVLFISFLDPRIVLFVFLLVFIWTAFSRELLRFVKTVLIFVLTYVCVHAYWIIPALMYPGSFSGGVGVASGVEGLNFVTIGHALNLLQPHWFKNVFGKVVYVDFWFAFIPVLALTALIVNKRSKILGFWLVILVLGIFFAKGTNPPVGEVYRWMSVNIPGFWLFRDSSKFYFLVALAFCVLVSFAVSKMKMLGTIFVVGYFAILLNPVWRGKMTGYLSSQSYREEHRQIEQILEDDVKFGRVLWIPSVVPSSYSSPLHPQVLGYLYSQNRPFETARIGTYEVYNFLREEDYVGDLLDVSSISYLAYPYVDIRREQLSEDGVLYYGTFLSQLNGLDWTGEKLVDEPVALLSSKKSQDRFFMADRAILIYGSERVYDDFSGEMELSDNALIFAEEEAVDYEGFDIALYNKDVVDVVASSFNEDYYFPSQILRQGPNVEGWWKRDSRQYFEWRNFLHDNWQLDMRDFDYGGGVVVCESNCKLQIENRKFQEGKVLFVRAMVSPRGGAISFKQGGETVGYIETKMKTDKVGVGYTLEGERVVYEYDEAYYKWFEVGGLVENRGLEIYADSGINAINAILVVDNRRWQMEIERKQSLMDWRNVDLDGFGGEVEVTYEQISPSEFEVEVKGLSKRAFMVFTDKFDGNWMMGDQSSVKTYSMVNGFWVERDGVYRVYYAPQRVLEKALPVSVLAFLAPVGWLLWRGVRNIISKR